MAYFQEFSIADTMLKGIGLAVGLSLGAIGLTFGIAAGIVGLGVGLCATAGAGVIVGTMELFKLFSNGYPQIKNAIEEIPGFDKKLFQDPKKFEEHFNIGNPEFIKILRKELDDQIGIVWQQLPDENTRLDIKYITSFYPNDYRLAALRKFNSKIGFSSAIVTDSNTYDLIDEYKKNGKKMPKILKKKKNKASRDYGVIFKYRDKIITDIWCIKYKKVDKNYVYYPFRLKCSDTINPRLYKKRG